MKPTVNYGLDAPPVIRMLILSGLLCMMGVKFFLPIPFASIYLASSGCLLLISGLGMIYSSKKMKPRLIEKIVADLGLEGHEQVLDVGCGRGQVLCTAAKYLTTGKAVGIDIWQAKDQTDNHLQATLKNAERENVAGRVDVKTMDMRNIEFQDASFDVILSCLAIHNLPSKEARKKALEEMSRVLKPGGKITLIDFRSTGEYAETLRDLGFEDIAHFPRSLFLFPPARMLSARKP